MKINMIFGSAIRGLSQSTSARISHEFSSRSTRFSSRSRRVFKPEVALDLLTSKELKLVVTSGPQLKSQPIAQFCRFFREQNDFC